MTRTSMKYALAFGLSCALSSSQNVWAGTAEEEARKSFEQGLALEATQPAEACKSFRKSLEFTRELGPLTKVKECDVREGRLLEGREKLRELTTRLPAEDPELPALKAELDGDAEEAARAYTVFGSLKRHHRLIDSAAAFSLGQDKLCKGP